MKSKHLSRDPFSSVGKVTDCIRTESLAWLHTDETAVDVQKGPKLI
jgi:hypothetical protein